MITKTDFIAQERWDQGYEKLSLQGYAAHRPLRA